MTHVGNLIEHTLHCQGRTVTWFAHQMCCTRANIYKMFRKESIDMYQLWKISEILHFDFFLFFSNEIQDGLETGEDAKENMFHIQNN